MKLAELGWSPFFEQQRGPDEPQTAVPGRITGMQRSGLRITWEAGERQAPVGGRWRRGEADGRPAVGDWVLFDPASGRVERLLRRKSLLKRVVSGKTGRVQLIGANIDTLFVLTSCDAEFNLGRLERYLSLAHDGGIRPVLILTKRDLARNPSRYVEEARALERGLDVYSVNALDRNTLDGVAARCGAGLTIALAGSSGVGKSSLVNTLCGAVVQTTGAVRGDRKGRHTTASRSLHPLPQGGWLLDSPGMRALPVAGAGVAALFEDVRRLAQRCRFADCAHGSEPGCAVRLAIVNGELDERRLRSYLKLRREEAESNTEPGRRRGA